MGGVGGGACLCNSVCLYAMKEGCVLSVEDQVSFKAAKKRLCIGMPCRKDCQQEHDHEV